MTESEQKKVTREYWGEHVDDYFRTYLKNPSAQEALEIIVNWVETVTPEYGHVLDLGCGPGYMASVLAEHKLNLRVDGVDVSSEMVRYAQSMQVRNAAFFVYDAETFQSPWRYNTIIAKGLIEYLETDKLLFKNVHKHLLPDGHFIAEFRNAGFTHGDPDYVDPYPMKRRAHDREIVTLQAKALGLDRVGFKYYHFHKGLTVPEAASAFIVLFKKSS